MSEAVAAMQQSMKASAHHGGQKVEDSVEALIKKLEGQGKKIKIIEDGDEGRVQEEDGEEGSDYNSPEMRRKRKKAKTRFPNKKKQRST